MTDEVKVLKTSMCYIRLLKKEHVFQKRENIICRGIKARNSIKHSENSKLLNITGEKAEESSRRDLKEKQRLHHKGHCVCEMDFILKLMQSH